MPSLAGGYGSAVAYCYVALTPLLRLPRTSKVVLTLFGVEVWQPLGLYTRSLLRRVNKVLSISDHTWQQAVRYTPQFATIPHQVIHLGTGVALPTVARPATTPTAFVISRLAKGEDYKGHQELIAAWPSVLQRIPDAQLWIGGDGDLCPILQAKVADHGLSHAIHFLGRISDDEKAERITQSRCFVMPSRGEGFGLVYLEAMQQGRPCLVSTVDAGKEVVLPAQAGLAVDPADSGAVADALCRLLTLDAQWEQWSQSARAYYAAHYTAAHYQQRLLTALQS